MSMTKMLFKVYLKAGLGSPFIIEAESMNMAARLGLAEYRRNTYGPDLTPIDKIIDHVELVEV